MSIKPDRSTTYSVPYPFRKRPGQILDILNQQRDDGSFCDVKLKIGPNKVIHAHKSVLVASSPYFESMFTSQFIEASSEQVDLSHATDNSDVLEKVISAFYGQWFDITATNVGETLNLATMFLLVDLKETCARVLNGMLNVGTAAEILLLALNYDLKDLQERVLPLLKSRFHDCIMFQEEVMEYRPAQLEFCNTNANIKDIARKSDYLALLLKWFSCNESDASVDCLALLLNDLPFKVTISVYKDSKKAIDDILQRLSHFTSKVSTDKADELQKMLISLKPDDFDTFPNKHHIGFEFYEPVKQPTTFGYKCKVIGCRNEDECYTQEEETDFERNQDMVDVIEHHRELERCSEAYPPYRPNDIDREMPWAEHLTRRFRQKTERELLEQSRLVDMVIVMAVGSDFAGYHAAEVRSMDICGYVPGTRAWYKLGSINVDAIIQTMDETAEDMNIEEDVEGPAIMRWESPMRHHRDHFTTKMSGLPPLSDKKWGINYLRHKLYFYHQDYCEYVFIYDLLDQSWLQTHIDAVDNWNGAPITVESIDLIVLGQILYGVIRLVIYKDQRTVYMYTQTNRQEASVIHKIYRFNEEDKCWYHVVSTDEHSVTIHQDTSMVGRRSDFGFYRSFVEYSDIPMMRHLGTFRTLVFGEDDEKLNVMLLMKMYNEIPANYSVSALSMVYLDLRKVQHVLEVPEDQRYICQPTPLCDDEIFVFINNSLQSTLFFDVRDPGTSYRLHENQNHEAEGGEIEYWQVKDMHPLRPAMLTSDGNRMWILNGCHKGISSLTEYTISVCRETKHSCLNKHIHSPPPFNSFAMACTGKLDNTLIYSIQPPTKFLHS